MKSANPDGRFWIKLDATDVKTAVMESGRRVWNGDEDLGDGQLEKLREEYDERYQLLDGMKSQDVGVANLRQTIPNVIDQLEEDVLFLDSGLEEASAHFEKKFQQVNCPEETLKEANWEVIEFQTLLQQSQELKLKYEDILPNLAQDGNRGSLRIAVKDLAGSTHVMRRKLVK